MTTQQNTEDQQKKTWTTPKLVVYGDVEKITKELPTSLQSQVTS